ncbi:hypothetical protein Z043_118518 [Scleropages formosus]|uniref:COS domain-containing protein n=1 Tax=Scleropages formosus TaxID=113540 RepID=A0A0P7UUA0_SCLFO|nr:hypothetical protein Z043_118518 [Scleropages formosus]
MCFLTSIFRVTEATKTSTVEALEPGFENMDHYRVDFNAEERALYLLDFVKTEDEVEEVQEEPEAEPEPEPEPDPEAELDREFVLDPEAVTGLKEDNYGIKGGENEDMRGQAEGCADPKKELLCDRKGLNTQQDEPELRHEEHGAGDLDIQSLLAEASEETKLYPSWYKTNSWQVASPSLPVCSEQPDGSEPFAQVDREQQLQTTWEGGSFLPMGPEDPNGHFIQGAPSGTVGTVSLTAEESPGIGEVSAYQGNGTTTSQQIGAGNASQAGCHLPPVTEPARIIFSFSWLNALSKKKK